MRKIIIRSMLAALVAVLFCAGVSANEAIAPRPQIGLAGTWKSQFVKNPGDRPTGKWDEMTLPMRGGWNSAPKYRTGFDGIWFERTIAVPAEWRDGRIVFRVGTVIYACSVYVNDRHAGDIPGYGGEIDISQYVNRGAENRIGLFLGRMGAGNGPLDTVTKAVAAALDQQVRRGGWDWGVQRFAIACRPDEFAIELRSNDLSVSDVWYRTYTRGYQRIDPLVTIDAEREIEGLSAIVMIEDVRDNKIVVREKFPLPSVARGRNTFNLPFRAEHLTPWEIRAPYLYRGQVVIADGNGKTIDRSVPTRFGVREFWAQGKDFYMNNHRVNFVFEWINDGDRAELDTWFERGVTLTHTNMVRPGAFLTEGYPTILSDCDELGMGLVSIGVTTTWLDLKDPAVVRDYTKWVEERLRRIRNHPSVLFYSVGLNSPGNYIDFSPVKIGRHYNIDWDNIATTFAYLTHKNTDSTRLYYFHGGPRGGDLSTGNVYFNWTPIQEVEDWLSEWEERGDRPIIVAEGIGGPISRDYYKNDYGYITEYSARLFGDLAYEKEHDGMVEFFNDRSSQRRWFWGNWLPRFSDLIAPAVVEGNEAMIKSWRFRGVTQKMWIFDTLTPDKKKMIEGPYGYAGEEQIWASYMAMLKPILVWIGGPKDDWTARTRSFASGEEVEKSIMVIRDLAGRNRFEFKWTAKFRDTDKVFASGEHAAVFSAFAREIVPIVFTAPDVAEKTAATLVLEAVNLDTGEQLPRDTFEFTIFPDEKLKTLGGATIAVFDPEGETADWLAKIGVATTEYERGKSSVLVIGRRALAGMAYWPFTADDLADGLTVVVMEQHCGDLERVGFRHEDRSPRMAFVRDAKHPILRGIDNPDLVNWRGAGTLISAGPDGDRIPLTRRLFRWKNRGTVASNVIETPHIGPFKTLIDCEFDLSYTPLLSFRHGRGEVIFCQLDLVGRVGKDPAATKIAKNLVEYATAPRIETSSFFKRLFGGGHGTTGQFKTAVCFDEPTRVAVAARGFAVKTGQNPDPAGEVLVISGRDARTFGERRSEIEKFAKNGGDVLVLYATAEFLSAEPFGGRIGCSPFRGSRAARKVDEHELLSGVGPQNVHWREPLEFIGLSGKTADFTPLLGGLAGVLKYGRGRFVFMQVEPEENKRIPPTPKEAETDNATNHGKLGIRVTTHEWRQKNRKRADWQINRLHSLLLANLGIRASNEFLKEFFAEMKPARMPQTNVDMWAYFGPIPATDKNDPLNTDISEYMKTRNPDAKLKNSRGELMEWFFPIDPPMGVGVSGRMDLSKQYGVRVTDIALAATQIWSSHDRPATIRVGADWWLKVVVNGKEVFRSSAGEGHYGSTFGLDFHNTVEIRLKKGWNDVICAVAAGMNGHLLWFSISDPGDVRVEQMTTTPKGTPKNLPSDDALIREIRKPELDFYTEDMEIEDDPYVFIPY